VIASALIVVPLIAAALCAMPVLARGARLIAVTASLTRPSCR